MAIQKKMNPQYILLLLSLLVVPSSCKRDNESGTSASETLKPATFEFYKTHSIITDPKRFGYLYEPLPETLPELCQVVQGLLLHVMHTDRYGVALSEQGKKEVRLREIEDILQRAIELSNRPLIQPRDPNNRVVSHCRDYAVLLCSFLRHKGVPARVRAGFATYFVPETHQTHWLCEYWCQDRVQWIMVDAQLDDIQSRYYKIDFDPLNVPPNRFIYAGQEFRLLKEDAENYDVRRSLIQDFAALNKIEVEIWDTISIMDTDKKQNPEAFRLLESIAKKTTSSDDRLIEIQRIYNTHSELQIPINQNESKSIQ